MTVIEKSYTVSVLDEWRGRILYPFLVVVAVASAVMAAVSIAGAIARPGQWLPVILYTSLALVLAVLAHSEQPYRSLSSKNGMLCVQNCPRKSA